MRFFKYGGPEPCQIFCGFVGITKVIIGIVISEGLSKSQLLNT